MATRKLDKNGNPIVGKQELIDSQLTLRDFLNRERGLTRRGDKEYPGSKRSGRQIGEEVPSPARQVGEEVPSPARQKWDGLAKDIAAANKATKDAQDARKAKSTRDIMMMDKKEPYDTYAETPDTQDIIDRAAYKKGGSVRGVGIAQRGWGKAGGR